MKLLENRKSMFKMAGITVLIMALLAGCGAKKEQEPPAAETAASVGAEKNVAKSKEDSLDGYPEKVVQFIVVRGAGGGTDNVARAVAADLEEKIGQPVVVMNVEGGDGLIGTNEALNAEPDGYTFAVLGSTEVPNLLVNGQGVKFTQDDVKAVCQLASKGNILILKKGSQFKTLDEFIEYGKQNPGRITMGVAGGNNTYLAVELSKALGIETTVVNGNNGNELYAQVLGGHMECAILGTQFYQNAMDEGMTVLGSTESRMEDIEGQPKTFKQQGYDCAIEAFTYLAAPAGVPDEICKYMSDSVGQLMEEGLKDKIDEMGQGGDYVPMEEMETYVKDYNQKMIDLYTIIKESK